MAAGTPSRRRPVSTWLAIGAICLLAVIGVLAAVVRYGPLTPAGRQFIEARVTGLKVGRFGRLRIEGLAGDPWRAFSIGRLSLADGAGVWLDARDIAVRWRWSALLQRRVDLTAVTARSLSLIRRPALSPPEPPRPQPVSIDVEAAKLRVEMAPAFSGRRGVYDLNAALRVERSGGAVGRISAASVLHAGDFLAADFDLGRRGAFRVRADAREAQGGALAGAAGMAADQPFFLAVRADGSARAGRFFVGARVGGATPLEARGAWDGAGGSADGRIALSASSLLARYQAMVGPEASFHVDGRKAADGFYALALDARSQNVTLTGRGEADLGRQATGPHGLAIDLRVNDPTRIVAFPKMGPARLKAGLGGDAQHWLVNGVASVDRPSAGDFSLARLSGPIRVEGRRGELAVSVSAAGDGGAGRGLVAALLGARPRGAADLTWFSDGRVLMRRLAVDGAGLKVVASGDRGLLGGLTFKGEATVSNLAAAHPGARGLVKAAWSASQGSAGRPWAFSFDARGQALAAGLGEVDRLLGAAPRLRAKGDYNNGVVAITRSTLDGAAGALTSAGFVGPAGALKLTLGWQAMGPLRIGPLEVDGAAKGSGALAGTFAEPRADLLADFKAVDLPSLPLSDAHVTVSFLAGAGGADGRFTLAAMSRYGPARAASAFRFAPGGLDLSGLDVSAGGVAASGSLALRQGEPSHADLHLAVGPGAILAQGHAAGQVKIVDAAGGVRATLSLTATDAVLVQGGAAFKTLTVSADGPLRLLPYQAKARGALPAGPWRLAGGGILAEASGDRTLTFAGAGRVGRADLRTLSPAEFRFGPHGSAAKAQLAVGAGRASFDFSQGAGAVGVKGSVSGVSLALINEDLIGRVDATLALAGRGPRLTGGLEARLTGAGGRDLKGSPPVDGLIKATLTDGAVAIDASLGDGQALKAQSQVTLPAEASAAPFRIAINRKRPMHGRFAIEGELGPLWDLAMGGERSLAGRVVAQGTLGGTLADPRALGTASLDNGRFQDFGTGLKLQAVTLRATLADNAVDVGRFSGADGARGSISGAGRISLLRDGLSSFRLDLKAFRLIDNDLAQVTASGQAGVNRAADGRVKLTGALTVDRAQIAPNPPVATGVTPMEVVEVHRPSGVDEGFSAQGPRAAPVALDVGIKAARGIFVKGRGLAVELSLDAHVSGTTAAPILTGVARVVRGDYDFAGKRFQFDDRGVVYLGASAETIRLNLTATRDDPALTAAIRITGTAARPVITLTSSPVLPQDEILSQVLFGSSAAQLSPLEAAQLASALAGLSGGGGFDVIGGLRNFAHLDRLAIGGNAVTGTTFSGGRYLTDTVYLELTGGGREGQSAQIEWRVRKQLSAVAKLGSQGNSQIAVRWRKDY